MPKQRKPKTTQRYSNIGVLDLPTGYLEIHDGVINFLKKKSSAEPTLRAGAEPSPTPPQKNPLPVQTGNHAGRSTCKRNPCREAGIAVEEKGRNTSIADSPGIRSLSSLLERSASTSQNNPSVHVAISRVPNRREREYPRVGRGGPSLLDDDSSTSLHKIRPPRMCIEVVIERGVLETEGVGGYFVCLGAEETLDLVNLCPSQGGTFPFT